MRHLREVSYYRTGGTCDDLFEPRNLGELAEIIKKLRKDKIEFFVLGGGTNSLVMDEHWAGAVILFSGLDILEREKDEVLVGAGVENSKLTEFCLSRELAGVSWMHRLPGQMGGTARMNARCYGGEISQVVTEVHAVTAGGESKVFHEDGMFRGYKDTIFMTNGAVIGAVKLKLSGGDSSEILKKMKYCEDDRKSKGQFDFPSCGCVFKNNYDVGVPSGMLLEAVGAKEMEHGGARVNPMHANFVFNVSADSRAILELSLQMREAVFAEFGVWLEYEMEILGRVPDDLEVKIKEARKECRNEVGLNSLRAKFKSKD